MPCEGVRVSEIQFESEGGPGKEGELPGWALVAGEKNPADLCARPQVPEKWGEGSMWQDGPAFIWEPESNWPIIKSFQKLDLEVLKDDEEARKLVGMTKVLDPSYEEKEKEVLGRVRGLAERCGSWDKYVGWWHGSYGFIRFFQY